jgi:probable rRNA maturation factor
MKINIQLQGKEKEEAQKYKNTILEAGEKVLSFMGKKEKSFSILLTDDQKMRELNRKFRNIDHSTDVLSFPYGEKGSYYLGDIAISLTKVKEQAKRYKEELANELARLVIHGVLHLLGEIDNTSKAKKKMWEKQEKILKQTKDKRFKSTKGDQ